MAELDDLLREFGEYDALLHTIDDAFDGLCKHVKCRVESESPAHDGVVDDDLSILHAAMMRRHSEAACALHIPDITSAGHVFVGRNWAQISSTPFDVFTSGHKNQTMITLTRSGNHLIISDENSHRLIVRSHGGEVIRTIGRPGDEVGCFDRPRGVAVDKKGHLWIADLGNCRVHCVTEEGQFLHRFNTYPNDPYSIAALPSGDIAVACRQHFESWQSCRIIIYTPAGIKTQTINGHGKKNENFGRYIGDIKVSSTTDELFVADSYNNQVHVFNTSNGQWLRSFGGSREEMDFPAGLALTPDGYVLVVEYSGDRVSVWSPRGQRVHEWDCTGGNNFKSPSKATILPNGRVAVIGYWTDLIQIF